MQNSLPYNEKSELISTNKKRLLFTVLSFLLIYLIDFIMDPFSLYWKEYFNRSVSNIIIEWSVGILYCYIISEYSIYVHQRLDRAYTWKEKPAKRLLVETLLNFIAVFAVNFLLEFLLKSCSIAPQNLSPTPSVEETRGAIQWITISILIALMIMGINIGIQLITNWRNESIRASELNQVVLETELQSLKLQIDPHFVFNNLSVLSELILDNQQLGYEYAENFSKIYRYMIINSKKDIISLAEELKFLDAYIFLIKHRFGSAVNFDININPAMKNLSLPPLSLQLLVENVLKHNKANKKNPLQIRLYTAINNELIVQNIIHPMESISHSSGIGLANIMRRYSILSSQQPQIINNSKVFTVILPLL